jgi:hypothetical protein
LLQKDLEGVIGLHLYLRLFDFPLLPSERF